MSKIKEIKISDFRVYEGTQKFEFENERGISNLIAIYAPNGYGKTSFFDAVEWGFSDKINRLEQKVINDSIKNERDFSKEDKVILTNRISYEKGRKGKIEIVTSNKILVKEVSFRKVRGIDTKNDYRPGILSGDFNQKKINNLPHTNLLSQDQIDSFLRYKSPEEKFESLKEFWPQGESALKKYEKIEKTVKQLKKELQSNEECLTKLMEELKSITFDSIMIKEINTKISALEDNKVLDIKYSKLEDKVIKKSYETLFKEFSTGQFIIEKKEKEENETRIIIEQLVRDLDSFTNQKEELEDLEKEIKAIIDKKSYYRNLVLHQELAVKCESNLKDLKKKISDYYIISKHREKYIENINRISELNIIIINEETNRYRLIQNIAITEKWIIKLERIYFDLLKVLSLKDENLGKLEFQINSYVENQEEKNKLKVQYAFLNNKIVKFNSYIIKKREALTKYELILEKKDWFIEDLKKIESWIQNTDRIKSISNKIITKRDELKILEKQLNDAGTLSDNLEKIKIWGEEYIVSTKASLCPLCNSKFDTFNTLIERILSNKDHVLQIDELIKNIEKFKKEINDLLNEKDVIEDLLKDILENEIQRLKINLNEEFKENDYSQTEYEHVGKQLKNLNSEIKTIRDQLEEYLEEGEYLSNSLLPKIKIRVKNKIDDLQSKVLRLEKVIVSKKEYCDLKKNGKYESERLVDASNIEIRTIKNESIFIELNELINIHNLKVESLKVEKPLNDLINELIVKEKKDIVEKDSINAKILELNSKIISSICKYEFDAIESVLLNSNNKKETLLKAIDSFKSKYIRYVKKSGYSKEELESEKQTSTKILEQLNEYQNLLNLCRSDLEFIQEGIKKSEIESKIQDLIKRKRNLEDLKVEIYKIQKLFVKYIQRGISNYFNKDVINQIYKRIEPHPKLTEIDFEAKIGPQGKPQLLITAKGSNDVVNPNLYLSAGQVNVLSLSIFLAKAFEYGQDTISTIFMDDPIQNLSDINILSFIDILRTLTNEYDKQIVISTHDEKVFRLLQNKLPEEYCNSKYIEFESEGKLKIN